MQTSIKQFQQNIINNVILNNQSPLSFEIEAPASFSEIKAISEKPETWFLNKVGQRVFTLSLFGFTGTIIITDSDHAKDLHCIAQAAEYRFNSCEQGSVLPQISKLNNRVNTGTQTLININ